MDGVIISHIRREGFEDKPLKMVPSIILVVVNEIDEHVVVAVAIGLGIHFPAPPDAFVAVGRADIEFAVALVGDAIDAVHRLQLVAPLHIVGVDEVL